MPDSIPPKKFYVYTLAYPDGRVFYVGKGTNGREQDHLAEAERGTCHCTKCRIIRRILKDRLKVRIEHAFETDDSREAYDYERELIQDFRRKYQLCNIVGNEFGSCPFYPHQAQDMTVSEYVAHLKNFDLTKKEQQDMILEFGILRTDALRKQWARARREHQDDLAKEIDAERLAVMEATGMVWQHRLPIDLPPKRG